jgi:hypothetical protein
MDDLNSVLLEGTVHGDIRIDREAAWFSIVSRHEVDGGDIGEIYNIVAIDKRLVKICLNNLEHGHRLRIVGKMRGATGQTMIVAEHVEFMPARRSEP